QADAGDVDEHVERAADVDVDGLVQHSHAVRGIDSRRSVGVKCAQVYEGGSGKVGVQDGVDSIGARRWEVADHELRLIRSVNHGRPWDDELAAAAGCCDGEIGIA